MVCAMIHTADAVKLVRDNLALCRLSERAQVVCADAMAIWPPRGASTT